MGVKTHRGGKYSKARDASGYYGTGEAGTKHELREQEWGTKREFIGSGEKEYTFYSETRGTLTIRADNYWEALRLAKARGYSRRQYRRKR